MHAGQINVTPGAERPGGDNLAADPAWSFLKDHQLEHAIVHQNRVANGNIIDYALVIYID